MLSKLAEDAAVLIDFVGNGGLRCVGVSDAVGHVTHDHVTINQFSFTTALATAPHPHR